MGPLNNSEVFLAVVILYPKSLPATKDRARTSCTKRWKSIIMYLDEGMGTTKQGLR